MNDKSKILILGYFGYENNQLDGQTVKTRSVYNLLVERYNGEVFYYDTLIARRSPLSLFKLLFKLIKCNTLIIIPALNNLTYIFPIVYYLSKIFNYEIIHVCVGGWHVEYFIGNKRFKPHPLQLKLSRKIKAFLPEMKKVDTDLKTLLGFQNSKYFPNFRKVEYMAVAENKVSESLHLVFMARINKKKGYRTIFNFAEIIKNKSYKIVIDFYGPIEENDKIDFLSLVDKYSNIVKYHGVLNPNDIYSTLSKYDIMLLPTTYYTEGFPGSILDAYIAGIPVIVTNWMHAQEFVKDGKTGFIVPFDDPQYEFNKKIMELYNNRERLKSMKQNARNESYKYSSDEAWEILKEFL